MGTHGLQELVVIRADCRPGALTGRFFKQALRQPQDLVRSFARPFNSSGSAASGSRLRERHVLSTGSFAVRNKNPALRVKQAASARIFHTSIDSPTLRRVGTPGLQARKPRSCRPGALTGRFGYETSGLAHPARAIRSLTLAVGVAWAVECPRLPTATGGGIQPGGQASGRPPKM